MWALILAAGKGERMFPLTLARAKPSLPFRGTPLVRKIAAQVSPFVNRIGVNIHHLPWEVTRALEGMDILFSMEGKLLGTCGGVKRMVEAFSIKEDIMVHNGDTLFLSSYHELIETHRIGKYPITLALCPYKQGYTRMKIQGGKLVLGEGDNYYCGVAIISKEILGDLPMGKNLITDFVSRYPVGVFQGEALEFTNPASYLRAHGQGIWLEEGAEVHPLALVENSIIMRDGKVARGTAVVDSIVVRGEVPPGKVLEKEVFIDGRTYPIPTL